MSTTRRDFLKTMLSMAATAGGALGASPLLPGVQAAEVTGMSAQIKTPNVLMIVNDEERHWDMVESLIPVSLLGNIDAPARGTFRSLIPARMELRRNGVRFSNYYTPTAPCCPARGIMYTGHHAPDNQLVDNIEFGQKSLRKEIPTIADVLGAARYSAGYPVSYYCAYKGKVHLAEDSDLETAEQMLDRYGFHDWQGPYGDQGDKEFPLTGTNRDDDVAGYAVEWLQQTGVEKNNAGQPWLLAVNFVNPHDIMMVDIDGDGTIQTPQGKGTHKFPLSQVPNKKPYYYWWNPDAPDNFYGKNGYTENNCGPIPEVLEEFASSLSAFFGNIPYDSNAEALITRYKDNAHPSLGTEQIPVPMWQAYLNYYLNCIIDNDRAISTVLKGLKAQGLHDSTIVIFTADHGELAMSHFGYSRYYDEAATPDYQKPADPGNEPMMPLRQKGPFVYEENTNLPFIVANLSTDPNALVKTYLPIKNIDIPALASSVDILPTLIAWAGKSPYWYTQKFGKTLAGLDMRDIFPGVTLHQVIRNADQIKSPKWAIGSNARTCVLFTADNISLNADYNYYSAWNRSIAAENVKDQGKKKKGIMRGIFDGESKYARYFSPDDYDLNSEAFAALGYQALTLAGANGQDLQLFDHSQNSFETFNKAASVGDSKIMEINQLLFEAMTRELYSTTRRPVTVEEFFGYSTPTP